MKNQSRNILALLASTSILAAASAMPAFSGETMKLTILGVGDVYNFDAHHGRGGVARINAVARAARAANPNTIYVFDGDMLSPSILSGFDHGQNMIDLTNIVPFDIAVPGNHEYDFGPENFAQKMVASKYPWAAVNITNGDGSPVVGLGGTMMKQYGNLKVALVPVAQDTTPEVSSSGKIKFAPTVAGGIAAAKAARKAGADLVIGVVQTDHNNDRALMKSHAFDVIMSGDDHDYTTAYDGITAYVETSIDGRFLAPLTLTVKIGEKRGKRKVTWVPNFGFIDTATVTPDPETQKMVDGFKAKLDASLNVKIGVTEGPLDSRRNVVRGQESAFGDLVADAMRAATGADIAITNGGGIRADRTYDAGTTLTRRDILTELPFGNSTVMTQITGAQVLAALENGVSEVEKGAGRFPQVSGLRFVYDPSAPAGARIAEVMIGGKPLNKDAVYKVATNDYIFKGGDGYHSFGGGKVLINPANGNLMANDVIAYIAATGKVTSKVEGRIKTVGQ